MTQPQTEAGERFWFDLATGMTLTEDHCIAAILAIEAQAAEPWQAKVAALREALQHIEEDGCDMAGESTCLDLESPAPCPSCYASAFLSDHSDLTAAANAWVTEHGAAKDAQIAALTQERDDVHRAANGLSEDLTAAGVWWATVIRDHEGCHLRPIVAYDEEDDETGYAMRCDDHAGEILEWPDDLTAAANVYTEQVRRDERDRLRAQAEGLTGFRYGSSLATPEIAKDDVLAIFEED
jgi:hypothetical protein